MNFKEKYPDFAAIETHIRHARAERTLAIAVALSELVMSVVNAVKRVVLRDPTVTRERERQAIASDAFLKRSVPRY
ncbi:MAG: hypothetical protein M3R58_16490 [Pseudomonadota bacterium]|nr:hypothetical protein [Pseudomonadota bacterium]